MSTTNVDNHRSYFYLFLLLAALLALTLGACRQSPPISFSESTVTSLVIESTERASITLRLVVDAPQKQQLASLIEVFELENPQIDVVFVSLEDDPENDSAETDYVRRLAEMGDVFPSSRPRAYPPQYLLDLTPFVEQDTSFNTGDFYPNLLENPDGTITVIPINTSYQIIYFNRELFDAAGISYPQNGWTLDDFMVAAQKLTKRDGAAATQWGYLPMLPFYSPLLASQLDAPAGMVNEPRLTDKDVVDGFNWIATLFSSTGVSPWLSTYREYHSLQPLRELIGNQQAGMWMATNTSFAEQQALVETLGAVAAPQTDGRLFAEPEVHGFSVSVATTQPEAAWKLVRYLSLQLEPDDTFAYSVPARRSIAETTDYWTTLPELVRKAVSYSAENTEPNRLWQRMWETQNVLAAIVEDDQQVTEVLQGIETDLAVDEDMVIMSTPEATTPPSVTKIRFSTFTNSHPVRILAEAYNAENPHIQVTVAGAPLTTGAAAYRGFDCYTSLHLELEDGVDHVVPIDTFLELDPSIQSEDYYPLTWDSLTIGGQRYGLPFSAIPPMIIFDRKQLDEIGVPYPQPGWTVDEFVELSLLLTSDEGDEGKEKRYGFYDHSYGSLGRLSTLLQMFDSSFIDSSVSPLTLDYAAASRAIGWYTDLVTLYQVMIALPTPGDNYAAPIAVAHAGYIADATHALQAQHLFEIPTAEELAEENAGIVPLPVGPSGYSGSADLWTINFYINRNSEHKQACWNFISYLSREFVTLDQIPARIESSESTTFEARFTSEYAASFRELLRTGQSATQELGSQWDGSWLTPGWLWLQRARDNVMMGNDLNQELARSQEQWNQYRKCVIAEDAFENQTGWIACAVQVDPKQQSWYDTFYTITDPVD